MNRGIVVNKPSLEARSKRYFDEQDELLDRDSELHGLVRDLKVLRYASSTLLMQAYSNWERFLSDWHIMAVTVDASRLVSNTARAAEAAARDALTMRNWNLSHYPVSVALSVPSMHLTVQEVRAILDTRGRNLSLSTPDEMKSFEESYFASGKRRPHHNFKVVRDGRRKVADEGEWEVILLARAIRHALAHGSDSAGREMNDRMLAAARSPRPFMRGLGRGSNQVRHPGIGAYLDTELHLEGYNYGTRARTIVAKLRDAKDFFVL